MRVLFAVDLEEPAGVCTEVAELATRLGADLLILHVCSPGPTVFTSADPVSGLGDLAAYALFDPELQKNLDEAEASAFENFLARSFTGPVKASMRKGLPATTILEDAEEHDVDLVILGHRHHSRLERFLMGDVASDVVNHASRPVLLMPITDD
ncbi:MAG: universal stress protein [Rhodothermales bacterium]|nr:universal stress protein [Rhodothermales bacterium]